MVKIANALNYIHNAARYLKHENTGGKKDNYILAAVPRTSPAENSYQHDRGDAY